MATSAPPSDGSFPRPPRTFEDQEGRQIGLRADDDALEALVAMYDDFGDGDRSQGLPPRPGTHLRSWVADLLDDGLNVVARHGDRAVGHAVLVPVANRAELAIFVHPDYQQAGIGSRLIRALLGAGRDAGVETVWLCLERSNTVATNLYRSVGFETTAEGVEREMELTLREGDAASPGSSESGFDA